MRGNEKGDCKRPMTVTHERIPNAHFLRPVLFFCGGWVLHDRPGFLRERAER